MCGFVGMFSYSNERSPTNEFEKALELLKHRGPDSSGYVSRQLSHGQITLGFRRLAIIDLSAMADQPFTTSDGNFTIVFNGEIYNYLELRDQLLSKGHRFETKSDTEVLVCAWKEWGEASISKLTGMFSFIILDNRKQVLWCVRDAYGIKPFFYKIENQNILFGSEIRALLSLSKSTPAINPSLAVDYILGGEYDRSRSTFYEGVFQLEPGHFMRLDLSQGMQILNPKRWWLPEIKENFSLSFSEAAEKLREEFCKSVEIHMRSDVRVATALSGGLDSSAIVSVIRKLKPDIDIHTFSYIADDPRIDEAKWVDFVNKSTNSISHKVQISASDFRTDIDDLIRTQGEPFGSTSLYAQFRIYKAAHESGVTVMLDGQGADELLAGYFGYPESRIRTYIERREWLSLISFVSDWSKWPGRESQKLIKPLVKNLLPNQLANLLAKSLARGLNPSLIKGDFSYPERIPDIYTSEVWTHRRLMQRLLKEQSNGALISLLRHADRNSMRWSIESRVPFLNNQLTELVLSFPENFLLSGNGETKSVFREAMRGIVDENILSRRDKIGLATPQNSWVTQDLFEDKLLLEGLRTIDFLDFKETKEYLAKSHEVSPDLANRKWRILNLIKWKMISQVK